MRHRYSSSRSLRRGVSVLEISAASVVLMIAFTLLAQLIHLIGQQERVSEARELAVRTAANELESLLAADWDDLVVGEPQEAKAPDELKEVLRGVKIHRHVQAGEEPGSKRLRVELTWQDRSGKAVSPVSLVAWRYQPLAQEGQP